MFSYGFGLLHSSRCQSEQADPQSHPMTLRAIDKQARDHPTQEGGQHISNLFFFFGVKHLLHRLKDQPLFRLPIPRPSCLTKLSGRLSTSNSAPTNSSEYCSSLPGYPSPQNLLSPLYMDQEKKNKNLPLTIPTSYLGRRKTKTSVAMNTMSAVCAIASPAHWPTRGMRRCEAIPKQASCTCT